MARKAVAGGNDDRNVSVNLHGTAGPERVADRANEQTQTRVDAMYESPMSHGNNETATNIGLSSHPSRSGICSGQRLDQIDCPTKNPQP